MNAENGTQSIKVRENLYELKQHGSLDYPVGVYRIDLNKMYLGQVHWHWHEELEYILVTSGTASFFAGDSSYVLSQGQGMLINRNVLHSVKALNEGNCIFYSIVFHTSFLFGYRHSELAVNYLLPLTNHERLRCFPLNAPGTEKDPEISQLLDMCSQIVQVNEEKAFGYELLTKSLLLQTWVILLKKIEDYKSASPQEPKASVSPDEARAKAAITYISMHYAEQISLQDIADYIHISKSECCRCFKRCLQTTPFEYLIKYRIYSAASMFGQADQRLSVSDVAAKVGFNSSSYFNKLFKKYLGCTPTQFKRQINGNGEMLSYILGTHIEADPTFQLPT